MENLGTPTRDSILVVDDTPENIKLLVELLRDDYDVMVANNGERAIRLASGEKQPDLVLLDVMMPDMDGYEVIRRLKSSPVTRDVPVIFLTAKSEVEDETFGLSLGAADYITKPITPAILFARVSTQLRLKHAADFLRDKNEFLETEVAKRTRRIEAIQDATVLAMSSMAETRDNETGNHILRTQRYVELLARHLKDHPRFSDQLDEDYIKILFKSAPLHDIGKVGIPDAILLKPGKLTDEEFRIMKTHSSLGHEAICRAEDSLGMKLDFLGAAKEIALCHHEKWDGTGYPNGLKGDSIPLSARLMAIADVYDALISRRVYKEPMTHEEASSVIASWRGANFDPDVHDAFLAVEGRFREIAMEYSDE